MVLATVRKKADVAMGNAVQLKQESPRIVAQKRAVDAEIAALQKEAGQNRKFIAGLHETYVSGLLTRDEFVEMKEGYSRKFEDAVERVQHLQEQQNKLEKLAREYTSLAEQLKKIDGNTQLTAQLVDALIERVTVNSQEDIVIDFRFESGFDELMEALHG